MQSSLCSMHTARMAAMAILLITPAVSRAQQGTLAPRQFAIEEQVQWPAGQATPTYPAELLKSGVTGSTLAMFVVDTSGNIELPSVKIVRTAHPLFVDAVKATLSSVHLTPAMVNGHHVKQLVQVQYRFVTNTKPAYDSVQTIKDVRSFEFVVVGNAGPALSTGTEPLYIIDGKTASGAEMRALAKERIASVDVLKGDAAIAKYGDNGTRGVVLITTKPAP